MTSIMSYSETTVYNCVHDKGALLTETGVVKSPGDLCELGQMRALESYATGGQTGRKQ